MELNDKRNVGPKASNPYGVAVPSESERLRKVETEQASESSTIYERMELLETQVKMMAENVRELISIVELIANRR